MNYLKSLGKGACAGLLVWIVFIIADAFDELILDTDCFVGIGVCFAMPVVLFICYIVYYRKNRPPVKSVLMWFAGFLAVSFLLLCWIFDSVNYHRWIVPQKSRALMFDLNGIEYTFYGFSVIIVFAVLCLIFHLIRKVVGWIGKR